MVEDLGIKIQLGKKVRSFNLAEELSIAYESPETLNKQMSEQPAKYAWVAVLLAIAKQQQMELKKNSKTLHAQLSKKYRTFRENNDLKITENIILADIEADKLYVEHSDKLIDAEYNVELLIGIVEAFRQRKDMLISIGSYLRQERDSNISILKEKAKKTIKAKGKK